MVNEDIKSHDVWTEGAAAALEAVTVISFKMVQVFSHKICIDISHSSV